MRCIDPLRRKYVEFPTELHFDNWLQFWMNPQALRLEPRLPSDPVAATDNPAVKLADLVIAWQDGSTELQVIAPKLTSTYGARIAAMKAAGGETFRITVRTRDQIRSQRSHIECLERWRQAAALHADQPLGELTRQVIDVVPTSGVIGLPRLSAAVEVPHTLTEIVAVLARQHYVGILSVSPGSYFYEVPTLISRT
ncbi:hypothetical protein [Pandoraea sp. PE-S2R-1]|uniref:hypothetical protein n=1 Tax=Pandoraea sp. PE-S2R-1 TaxID=1986994 RepID=UPI000B3FFA96|nr:hypothetical protein [Pandoraea sp. PE-S2R-1]